ncbi:MAG TPA: ATP-binding cassette domain-containing protein [Candidatus Methylacidiphilales bacterium]|nr:ATP-binding cassette domain-containing protein [Candidatus Methylacidiphilales bacterium]
MKPVIEVRKLTKIYRTYQKETGFWGALKGLAHRRYKETAAANEVSFTVPEGELVGFLGPNGAGKTTVLKMLSGLLYPTRGEASVLGFTPWRRQNDFKRQFALILGQKNQLWWDLPASESLELNRVIYGLDAAAARKTIDELTKLLDVRDKLGVMVRELSLGERMKMELIAALLHQPRVLFLDEPTIGLDVVSQKKVREFLREYTSRRRITTLLTSHYMQDIEELCERVIIIDHGRVFFDGALQDIIDRLATHKIMTLSRRRGLPSTNFSAYGEVLEKSPTEVRLKIARPQIVSASRDLIAALEIDDFTVEDVPIEDIIREVFSEHRNETNHGG